MTLFWLFVHVTFSLHLAFGAPLIIAFSEGQVIDGAIDDLRYLPVIEIEIQDVQRVHSDDLEEMKENENSPLADFKDELELNSYALYRIQSLLDYSNIENMATMIGKVIENLKQLQNDVQALSASRQLLNQSSDTAPLIVGEIWEEPVAANKQLQKDIQALSASSQPPKQSSGTTPLIVEEILEEPIAANKQLQKNIQALSASSQPPKQSSGTTPSIVEEVLEEPTASKQFQKDIKISSGSSQLPKESSSTTPAHVEETLIKPATNYDKHGHDGLSFMEYDLPDFIENEIKR